MEKIDISELVVEESVVCYLIGNPEELEKNIPKGCHSEEVIVKPGDALLLWYKDRSDHDDDFKLFDVYEGEKVFKIVSNS